MQATNNLVQIAQKSAIISLNFRQWTGACRLTENDFVIGEGGKMPPKAVVSQLGQKKLVDPTTLHVFANIKNAAKQVLEDNGVQCCSGYLVPLTKAPAVIRQIRQLRDKYNLARDEFVNNLPIALEQWAAANPQFADRLRLNAKTKEEIERKIHADYTVCGVIPLEIDEDGTLLHELEGLSSDLMKEVAERCRELQVQSLSGRELVGQRVVNVLRKMREKLNGLSFLSGAVMPLVRMIDEVLLMLPKKGNVEGRAFVGLNLAVSMLSNPQMIDEICEGKASFAEAMKKADASAGGFVFNAPEQAPKQVKAVEATWPQAQPQPQPKPVQTHKDDLFGDLAEIFGSESTACKTEVAACENKPEIAVEEAEDFFAMRF